MTRYRRSPASHRYQGFSLIELLVSMTIGLVITVAAGSAYLGASTAGKVADAQSRMNEDGQAALNILTQHLRMVGSNPNQPNRAAVFLRNPVYDPTYVGATSTPYASTTYVVAPAYTRSPYSIRGCDGTFTVVTAGATDISVLNCAAGANTLPDSIAISYEADLYNTKPDTNSKPTDCLGNPLTVFNVVFTPPAPDPVMNDSFSVAVNRFYIATSGSVAAPTLFCKGNGGNSPVSPQPLVENIEDMQFTYGTVSTSAILSTATVAGYLRANEVASLVITPSTAADDSTRWGKVLSVRICVLVRSETLSAPDAASARYDDCQGARNVAAPDLRLRRAYFTTVVLRNRRF